ncbi:MAG: MarR family winged helix-turn-helix transcriptional regulator [Mycobacteriales bacterium]
MCKQGLTRADEVTPHGAPSEQTLEFVRLLTRLARGLRRAHPTSAIQSATPDHYVTSANLAPRHIGAMVALLAMSAPVTVSDLAESLQVNLTTASLLAAELASAGLLTRSEDPADHRRTLLFVDGVRARELLAAWLAPLDHAFGELPERRRRSALGVLRTLADGIDRRG